MRTSIKKYLGILISVTITGVGVVLACAGGWYTIEEATNYTPQLFVDSTYSPFFYSYDYYYDIGHDEKQNDRFNATIVEDWYNYFDKKFPKPEIETILFKTFPYTIDSLIRSNAIPARLADLKIANCADKKVCSFLGYLNIAKQSEVFALRGSDEWYYDEKPAKVRTSSADFCAKVLKEFKSNKDKFIKQRYLFQLVRAYYFNKDYANCVKTFESNQNDFPKNTMYYRTLSYVAGAHKKTGKISEANYYYSLVYNSGKELKTTAHYSFKPQEEKDWQQTLALCKNNDEKCTLWQMLGVFYKDEQRSIEEIIKIDPKSDKCDLLISRAVNKLEGSLFESGVSNEQLDNNNPNVKTKLKDLIVVLQTALTKGLSKAYQWQMALGYLQILDHQYKNAGLNLNAAEKGAAAAGNLVTAQLRILKIINSISEIRVIDKATEDKLLPELEWLSKVGSNDNFRGLRTNAALAWMRKTMCDKYHNQKDLMKAEFFGLDRNYYVNSTQFKEMRSFLERTDKTPYEKFCVSVYELGLGDLYEYEAIDKTFADNIDEAIAVMEKTQQGSKTELLSNPFNGGIKDCHDCDHAQTQKTKFTKLSTLKKMKEMKDKLSVDTYNNAMLLANVYYNITFYGSSRVFYYCKIMDGEQSSAEYLNKIFVNKLTDMSLAAKYYKLALEAAKTDEQRAKCVYMLSKCERNQEYHKQGDGWGIDLIPGKNFTELKKYANTKYYKEIISECGYFKKFARK